MSKNRIAHLTLRVAGIAILFAATRTAPLASPVQNPALSTQAFEVASVKRAPPPGNGPIRLMMGRLQGDRWMAEDQVARLSRSDIRRIKDYITEQEQPLTDETLATDILNVRPNSACLVTRLIDPPGSPRPSTAAAGPFSTSTRSIPATSRCPLNPRPALKPLTR